MLSIVIISEKEIEVSGGGEFKFLLLFKLFEVYFLKNVLLLQFKKWKEKKPNTANPTCRRRSTQCQYCIYFGCT